MIPVPRLPEETLGEMKTRFDTLLRETKRQGVEDMIVWLESTDFYTAPASTRKHGAIEGGLLRHSLSVQKYMQNFSKPLEEKLPEDSIVIVSLLHDVCKADFYGRKLRNVKIPEERRWEEQESFTIDDQFPLGHGEKSLFLVQRHIPLTDDEALAIRWHMGGFDDAARAYASGMTLSNAFEKCKLAVALHVADMYTANMIGH